MHEVYQDAQASMKKVLENLNTNFAKVRTGRANANVLNNIMVDYYGQPTPITHVAGVKVPEAHMLVVEPWDKSILNAIEKAVQSSDLGITPSNDGSVIRLPFPAPTEERRRDLVKECKEYAEEARIGIRNVRRDANNKLDKLAKDGELSEDENRREQGGIQKLTDEHIASIDEALKNKEAEVMEV